MDVTEWSNGVAELVVDALVGAGYITKDKFESAMSIVAEEIIVRLALGDYPPPQQTMPPDEVRSVATESE